MTQLCLRCGHRYKSRGGEVEIRSCWSCSIIDKCRCWPGYPRETREPGMDYQSLSAWVRGVAEKKKP
jgi:hypothetical protein